MPKKQQRTRDKQDADQSQRFIDTAREHGADETEEGADRAFKRVSSSPNKDHSQLADQTSKAARTSQTKNR